MIKKKKLIIVVIALLAAVAGFLIAARYHLHAPVIVT